MLSEVQGSGIDLAAATERKHLAIGDRVAICVINAVHVKNKVVDLAVAIGINN